MGKGKILVAILLVFAVLAGVAGTAYYLSSRATEPQIEDETPEPEPPDNSDVIDALRQIISLLENGIENRAAVNGDITSRLGALSARVSDDRGDIDGIMIELENVFGTLYFLEDEIEALEVYDDTAIYGLYNSVLGSLATLLQDSNVLAVSHADLVRLYENVQTLVNGLENDMESMDLDLAAVKSGLQEIAQTVAGLQSGYSEISASLNNAHTLINHLSADFDLFRTDFEQLNETVAEILTALSALEDSGSSEMLLELQSDIAEMQDLLLQQDSALQALQGAVDGMLYDNYRLDDRVGSLENLVQSLESTVSSLYAELMYWSNPACSCSDYSWDVYYMNQRLDALESLLGMLSDYSGLDGRIYTLEYEIWELQSRMLELESRMEDMQAGNAVELITVPLVFNPDTPQANTVAVPYEISAQLAERDSFKITYGVLLDGGILLTGIIELQVFRVEDFPVIAAADGVSFMGVEWFVLAALVENDGAYVLQFEVCAFPELWEIGELRILSVRYDKGENI